MSIKPLSNRILVKRKSKEEKTEGGLYLPDKAKEAPNEGVVVTTGPGRRLDNGKLVELDVRNGDTVLFAQLAGIEIGEDLLILEENDILAKKES